MGEGSSGANTSGKNKDGDGRESDGKSLVAYTGNPNNRGGGQDFIRRSDIYALIKMLKENGKTCGYSFGALMIAKNVDNGLDKHGNAKLDHAYDSTARIDNSFKPSSVLCHTANNMSNPLVVDSGASHHMISD